MAGYNSCICLQLESPLGSYSFKSLFISDFGSNCSAVDHLDLSALDFLLGIPPGETKPEPEPEPEPETKAFSSKLYPDLEQMQD